MSIEVYIEVVVFALFPPLQFVNARAKFSNSIFAKFFLCLLLLAVADALQIDISLTFMDDPDM